MARVRSWMIESCYEKGQSMSKWHISLIWSKSLRYTARSCTIIKRELNHANPLRFLRGAEAIFFVCKFPTWIGFLPFPGKNFSGFSLTSFLIFCSATAATPGVRWAHDLHKSNYLIKIIADCIKISESRFKFQYNHILRTIIYGVWKLKITHFTSCSDLWLMPRALLLHSASI